MAKLAVYPGYKLSMNPLISPVKSGLRAMISVSVVFSVSCFLKLDVSDARGPSEPGKEKTPDGVQARLAAGFVAAAL